ncbi:MAG: ABC transporter permease [bacterium]|nr:ABC transporter permease [bacterium]
MSTTAGDATGMGSGGATEPGDGAEALRVDTPFERATIGLGTSLLAVVAALGLGAVILAGSGQNPLTAYGAILAGSFGDWFAIGETLARAAPLAVVGVGAAIALRAGVITIGAQGQLIAGSLGALCAGFVLQDAPAGVAVPLAAIAGALFGMVWVVIPALLRAHLNVNEILSTLLFNEFAFLLLGYLLNGPLKEPAAITPKSDPLADSVILGDLVTSTRLHAGVLAVVVMVALFGLWTRSTMGYRYDLFGENPRLAHSLGIPGRRIILNSLLISGALAGLAGWLQAAGLLGRLYVDIAEEIGFFGLVVAMLGGARPLGILAAALLVGALQAGGLHMQATEGIPASLSDVIQALILLGFAVRYAPQIAAIFRRAVRSVGETLGPVVRHRGARTAGGTGGPRGGPAGAGGDPDGHGES